MESQVKEETEWFLSKIDSQGRVTIDSGFRELYSLAHKDKVWVKIRKVKA